MFYTQEALSKGGPKINKTRTRTESDVLGGAFGMVAATVYGAVTGSI